MPPLGAAALRFLPHLRRALTNSPGPKPPPLDPGEAAAERASVTADLTTLSDSALRVQARAVPLRLTRLVLAEARHRRCAPGASFRERALLGTVVGALAARDDVDDEFFRELLDEDVAWAVAGALDADRPCAPWWVLRATALHPSGSLGSDLATALTRARGFEPSLEMPATFLVAFVPGFLEDAAERAGLDPEAVASLLGSWDASARELFEVAAELGPEAGSSS